MAEIRAARPGDARRIAEIHVASWRAAYRGLMPDEVLDGLSVERREEGWTRQIEDTSDANAALVAEVDGRIVGFTLVGVPHRKEDAGDGSTGELHAIYLDPSAWGRGIGQALLAEAVARLRKGGFAEAMLWVVEGNARTRRFYELAGWETDGGYLSECMPGIDAPAVRYRIGL